MNVESFITTIAQCIIIYQEVINVIAFVDDVLIKQKKGQIILGSHEFGERLTSSPNSRFPQVLEITYKIDNNLNVLVLFIIKIMIMRKLN